LRWHLIICKETAIIKKNTSRGIRFITIQHDLSIQCTKAFPIWYDVYTWVEIYLALSSSGLIGLRKGIRVDINEELRIELNAPGLAASA
jgi:hypothetical protein